MDAALEGAQADGGRGDVGRLRVVDEANAADLGDGLEPVRDAGEGPQPLADRLAVEAHRQRRGGGGHRVGDVVLAEQTQLIGPQQRLAVVEDRPLGEGHLAIGAGAVAEGDPPAAAAEVGPGEGGVVGVVDRDVVVALVGEDPELRRQVGVEVGVAIEVVGREVEEDRALGARSSRCPRAGSSRPRRRSSRRVDLTDQRGERGADVAGDRDRLAGAAVDVSEQLDRGRLAVGPGHRQEPVRDRPPGQLELAEDLDPRARARRRSPAPPREPPGS